MPRGLTRVLIIIVLGCLATTYWFWPVREGKPSATGNRETTAPTTVQSDSNRQTNADSGTESGVVAPRAPASPTDLSPQEQVLALKQEELALAQRLVQSFPDDDRAWVLLGNIYRVQGQSSLAVPAWNQALRINPRLADVCEGLGQVAEEMGDEAEAIRYWQAALAINPDVVGVIDASIPDSRNRRRGNRFREGPGVRCRLGQAYLASGKPQAAVAVLQEETQAVPASSLAWFLLGQAYLRLQNHEEARRCYEKTLELDPQHANACHGLINVCLRLKQSEPAQAYMERFKALKAEEIAAQRRQNQDYLDLEAVRERVVGTCLKAEAMYRAHNAPAEADAQLQKALALVPDHFTALRRWAELTQVRQDWQAAFRLYQELLARQPDDVSCLLNHGLVASQLGKVEDARQAFERVLAVAPEMPEGYRELAKLLLRTGQEISQAVGLAEKAVALAPVAESYYVLSWAQDKAGHTEPALATLQKAVDLEPQNPKYRDLLAKLRSRDRGASPP